MLECQRAHGPGPARIESDPNVAMGKRLFAVLPEDRFDSGPLRGRDGTLLLVADIRLSNRDELIASLGLQPGRAAVMADAAILMRALEQWGEEALVRLAGDFAFVAWDHTLQRCLLARDLLGQRPLHYHRRPGFFAFSSMPRGLHALPELPRAPDRQAVADFLALLPEAASDSFFKGVERVPPGHIVKITRSGTTSRPFWSPPRRLLRLRRPEEYAEALRVELDNAVKAALRGAGPRVAAQLSSGLDSTAVTATAAQLLGHQGGSVVAFTSVPRRGFEDPGIRGRFADEGPLAAQVAALHPNIEHVLVTMEDRSPLDGLDRAFFLYERPYLNLCNGTWVDAINDAAKARRLPVMLGAVMGNATFSYGGHQLFPQLLLKGRWLRLIREIRLALRWGVHPESVVASLIGPFVPRALWRAILRMKGRDRALAAYSALHPNLATEPALLRRAAERGLDLSYRPKADPLEARLSLLRGTDFGNYNKGTLAGWGIDYRDPAGDRRLIDFCLSLPVDQFLRDGVPRALARSAFSDRLPAELLTERRSGYQGADWYEGVLRARPQAMDELERIRLCAGGADLIDTQRLLKLMSAMPQSESHTDAVVRDYRLALLRGISAGHFLRKATGSNR